MRLLVIEDKDIISYLKRNLEEECFAVDIAHDGEQASYLARTNDYDLIVLKDILEKKSCLEVCADIRKSKITSPILIISLASDTKAKVALLNNGADDCLSKPFTFEELVARIRALLRRPKAFLEEIMRIEDLVVDIQAQTARRGKKEVILTRKEFMLIEYLLRNRGMVLSRAMLMEHVWDMSIDPFSNTIESHIASLRKKVDLAGKKKLIHTLSGRGYKLDLQS